MAVAVPQNRKRTCSFSSPLATKAPRLTSSKSIPSFRPNHTPAMACAVDTGSFAQMPYTDLTRSQYLWPSAAVGLRAIATNASARAEYKAQLRREYECSKAFQKQFAEFVAQLVHAHIQSPPSLDSSSVCATVGLTPHVPESSHWHRARSQAAFTPQPPPKSPRRRITRLLVPPRPRVASPLSAAPVHTSLPGPARRPMPLNRGREPGLLKQAVMNTERGRSIMALGVRVVEAQSRFATEDVIIEDVGEKLTQSWVVVPGEDWEMVDTREVTS